MHEEVEDHDGRSNHLLVGRNDHELMVSVDDIDEGRVHLGSITTLI